MMRDVMAAATALVALLLLFAPRALAQGEQHLKARLEALEQQNRAILERLQKSEDRNHSLEGELDTLRTNVESDAMEANLEANVNALIDGYQDTVTWKTLTKSGLPIRFYGFFRFDAYFQTARSNSIILPAVVAPENNVGADSNNEDFALDVRLTRFAFDLDAGQIGDAHVTGKLETDFANFPNGSPESRETPRIRLAYTNIDFGAVTIRLGQDWDVISPLYPSVNAELLMWNAGNLGDRRPQAQFMWETGNKEETTFMLELSAGLTGAINNQDLDVAPGPATFTVNERDGFDSGLPGGQGRASVGFNSWVEGKRGTLGVWGAIARLETDGKFGGQNDFTSWTVGADLQLPLFGPVSMQGEIWYGQALADFRGNVAQFINTATGDEIAGWGGWAELHWQVTDTFRLAVGGSIDDPDNGDLNVGVGGQNVDLNYTLYVSSKLDWGGGLVSGLDLIFWKTEYNNNNVKDEGDMVRFNFWTALYF